MGKIPDLIGQRYGKLIVIESLKKDWHMSMKWLCKCDCGNTREVTTRDLNRHKKLITCGCGRHGNRYSRLYEIYANMKQRCYNQNKPDYHYYGNKGVKICDEWLNDFNSFYSWALNNGYSDSLTIDRKEQDGDYSPDNCRWATRKEQSNNLSSNVTYEINNIKYTISELSSKYNIPYKLIQDRICKLGWTPEESIAPTKTAQKISLYGEELTFKEISLKYGINIRTLRDRNKAGKKDNDLINKTGGL